MSVEASNVLAAAFIYFAVCGFTGVVLSGYARQGRRAFEIDEAVVCGMVWPVLLVVFIAHGVRKLWRRREKVSVPKARVVR